jgi:hypothetical protein
MAKIPGATGIYSSNYQQTSGLGAPLGLQNQITASKTTTAANSQNIPFVGGGGHRK